MYDVGKVLIIGGGNLPQKTAEMIDLPQPAPKWIPAGEMSIGRRQQNATLLPDGTVLVTGGTSGPGFNDLTSPVLKAELWIPPSNSAGANFIPMASESVPRLYHSTAVLLPDARVLSAGGGEYRPADHTENDPKDSKRNAQIFSPPYLFRSTRPEITSAPAEVSYGQAFDVATANPAALGQVNWIPLSSV